jgi:ABC-2 type transport system ATP-binding protein
VQNAAVMVHQLVVVRRGNEVLHGISCEVTTGSVTGLFGPSGSGKTTLMRAIVGVQLIKSGNVTALGRPAGSPQLRSEIGYVTQSPSVYADLTVRQNARYFAAVHGMGAVQADRVIRDVGLRAEERQLVSNLSGGQLARASLACALLGRPGLLVLDEPTVGLDPVLREDLWDMFRHLQGMGRTLIISSHVMDEAARCDTILLMREGTIVAHDTPEALMTRTGTNDLDQMFLVLIRTQGAS